MPRKSAAPATSMSQKPSRSARPRAVAALVLAVLALPVLALLGLFSTPGLAGETAPLVQQGPKLTGAAEEVGAGGLGHSVALSAAGDTALVGGPGDSTDAGAAWPFVRSGEAWAAQGGKLTGAMELGEGRLGVAVALSADGDTALVGAPNDDGGIGAVWVYRRSGSSWSEQAKLTGTEAAGDSWFGRSVAISADGNTALIGGFVDHNDVGAAWVFTRSGSTWTQQGPKLTGGEESGAGQFGWSVALAGDGDTALIGGRNDNEGAGGAWVFARSGSTWTQQGPKLTGGEESGLGGFGWSVALSGDGDTALIGGQRDSEQAGAAWVFTRSGATWARQGPKLAAAGEQGAALFGHSVALSEAGDEALIGGPRDHGGFGAAWVYARSGTTWTQRGAKLIANDETVKGGLGWSVALSANGETALTGGLGDNQKAGAAWVFVEHSESSPEPKTNPEPEPLPTTTSTTATPGAQSPSSSGAADGPPPQQGVAAFHASGGQIVLLGRRLPVSGGRARVRLRCTAAAACRGRLSLALRVKAKAAHGSRLATLASAGFAIGAGHTVTVVLKLSAAVRQRLRSGRVLVASLTLRQLAPAPQRTSVYAVKLVAPRRR